MSQFHSLDMLQWVSNPCVMLSDEPKKGLFALVITIDTKVGDK